MPLPSKDLTQHDTPLEQHNSSSTSSSIDRKESMGSSSSQPAYQPPRGLRPQQPPKWWIKKRRTQIAAIFGTATSTLVTFPLESVKTRLQALVVEDDFLLRTREPRTFLSCVRTVFKEEGPRGFWRGCFAPMFSVTCVRTVGFSTYQDSKYGMSRVISQVFDREEPLATVNRPGSKPDRYTTLCFGFAGAVSGAVSSIVSTPFDTTKTAMVLAKQMAINLKTGKAENSEIKRSYMNKNTIGTFKQIIHNCGVKGLYCGYGLQLTREVIGTSTYFMAYEAVKQSMVAVQGANSPTSPVAVALAGGVCGMVSLVLTYPLDLVKTAYQKQRLENGMAASHLKPERVLYFAPKSYRGVVVAGTRSAITNAILFSFFEATKKYINDLPDKE